MLRAVQVVVDEGLAKPILVGRPAVIERRIERFGLRIKPGDDFEIVNPEYDPRYRDYWTEYYRLTQRRGVSQQYAQDRDAPPAHADRRDDDPPRRGRRHAVRHVRHARRCTCSYVDQVIGLRKGAKQYAAMNAVMLPGAHDLHRRHLRQLRSHGGADRRDHAARGRGDPPLRHRAQGRAAVALELRHQRPSVGEEDARRAGAAQRDGARPRGRGRDARRRRARRRRCATAAFPNSRLKGEANLLIMPTLDAANIAFNLLKVVVGRRA